MSPENMNQLNIITKRGESYAFAVVDQEARVLGQEALDAVSALRADIEYVPIDITSIRHGAGTVEIGKVLDSVEVSWSLNKEPASQTLNGTDIDLDSRKVTVTGPFSGTTKFTLSVTDERDTKDTASTTVSFFNGVYYGALAVDAQIDSAAILGLTRKLQGGREITFTVNAEGKRPVYAIPTSYKTPTFTIGGFTYEWTKVASVEFTNSSGHEELYDVWMHGQNVSGSITVVVT